MDKILILYSNPIDTNRIRLDVEHRYIDMVIEKHQLNNEMIVRRHAVTYEDIVKALGEQSYSIVQFSGHGSVEGIYVERPGHESGEIITADQIAPLVSKSQPNLKLTIFMCCFSASFLPVLSQISSYILTVFGPANDELSVKFIEIFYDTYFRKNNIEKSVFIAQQVARGKDRLNITLSRRALINDEEQVLFRVFPGGNHFGESFLIDLSQAEDDIKNLELSREDFLSTLTRKINLHRKIFEVQQEDVMLPIGLFFGIFSWKNAADVITCKRIIKIKPDLEEAACAAWTSLTLIYNDKKISKYRVITDSSVPAYPRYLTQFLKGFRDTLEFISGQKFEVLQKYIPEQFKISRSTMTAHLDIAEQKIQEGDYKYATFHLESSLSSLHDLLNALTSEFSVG